MDSLGGPPEFDSLSRQSNAFTPALCTQSGFPDLQGLELQSLPSLSARRFETLDHSEFSTGTPSEDERSKLPHHDKGP